MARTLHFAYGTGAFANVVDNLFSSVSRLAAASIPSCSTIEALRSLFRALLDCLLLVASSWGVFGGTMTLNCPTDCDSCSGNVVWRRHSWVWKVALDRIL